MSEDNDIYFGQIAIDEKISEDQLQCFEDECVLNTHIKKQIKLKRGNELIIKAENSNIKKTMEFSIQIVESMTILPYEVKYVAPYFIIMYNLNAEKFSNNLNDFHFAETDLQLKKGKSGFLDYSQFAKADSSKSITDVSEKFKCGKLVGSLNLYQSVASLPRPNEGRIVFSPGATQMHKLKICLKSIDARTEIQCHETLTNAGDEIQFDNIGILDDTVTVKLSNLKTPKIVSNLPDIIANYRLSESQLASSDGKSNNYNLYINDYHHGHTPSIGSMNYDSIAPIQTQCIHTKQTRCPYKSFDLNPFISWELMQKSTSGKDGFLQNEIIETMTNLYDPTTLYLNQMYMEELNPEIVKVDENTFILNDNIILVLSYDEIELDVSKLKILQNRVEANMYLANRYVPHLLDVQNDTQLYCSFVNTTIDNLSKCISESSNDTLKCTTEFLFTVREFNSTYPDIFEMMGVDSTNVVELVETIENSHGNFCLDYDNFEFVNREITRSSVLIEEQHAIFIAIFAIIALVATTAAAVGGAHGYAVTHNRCYQNEKDFPLEQQRTQIHSFNKMSSLLPSYYKELPEFVEIIEGRPSGIHVNITNYEDQTADLELHVNNYKLEFKELKTKITEFSIPECTYYHGKAIFTCNIVIINKGDVNEIPIKSTTPGVMTFKNTILISSGKNQLTIRLTAPDIVTSNVQICIKEDEWKCSTSKRTKVIDTPDIVGNNLIPIGSRLGDYDIDAEYFWYLLNLNLGFNIMMWVLWVIAFICLIILLIVIFRFIRCCFRKTKKAVMSPMRNIFVLLNILIMINIEITSAWPQFYSISDSYGKPNNQFGFMSSPGTKPLTFQCDYTFRSDETKLGDENIYITSFLYDIGCHDEITARYSTKSMDLQPDPQEDTNLISISHNVNYITKSFYFAKSGQQRFKIWKMPKRDGSINQFMKRMDEYFVQGEAGGFDFACTIDWRLNGFWHEKVSDFKSEYSLDKVSASSFINKYSQLILPNEPHGGLYYYISNVTNYYYYFNFWHRRQLNIITLSGVRNIAKVPNYLSISSLNKRTINEKTQPAIMLVSTYDWEYNGKDILRYIKGNYDMSDWVVDETYVVNKYTKIVELWCNKCNIKLDKNVYRIETGNIKIDNNYCLLPDGKITSVRPGRGPIFKCLCSDKICYCESESSKTFAKIKIDNNEIETIYEEAESGIRYRDIGLQCFSGDGGYVGVRRDGVFVAQDGSVITTNDNWKTFTISTENEPIKMTNIEFGTDSVIVVGKDTQTYMAKSKGNASNDDSFENVWNEMNKDFKWVIILTITLPAVLLFLLIIACCCRFYRKRNLTMGGLLNPFYKTANYITDLSGNRDSQMNNNMYKKNNYRMNNLNNGYTSNDTDMLKIRRRRNDLY